MSFSFLDNSKIAKEPIKKSFEEDLCQYASYDNVRNIVSVVDGLHNSGRKIVWETRKTTKSVKIAFFYPKVAEATQYLHNPDILGDTIVNLAVNYDCSGNNINVIKPLSTIGTKIKRSAAAPRYSNVRKSDIFDLIYRKEDEPILDHQEFEYENIEPRFLVPTIPMVLINTASGIGFGFANYLLPRNPFEIIDRLKGYLTKGKLNESILVPYMKGFQGTIDFVEMREPGKPKWKVNGVYKKVNSTTIEITELPFWYDLEKYMIKLKALKDKKVITSFKDESVGQKYFITIKVPSAFWNDNKGKDIHKVLDMTTDETENIVFVTERNTVKMYADVIEVLKDYIKVKLEYTGKRKAYQLSKLTEDIQINTWKANFIKAVVNDEIIVNKRSKADILKQIKAHKQAMGNNDDDRAKHLQLPIYNLTSEKIAELNKLIEKLNDEYTALENKTVESIWLDDIKELEKVLSKEFK